MFTSSGVNPPSLEAGDQVAGLHNVQLLDGQTVDLPLNGKEPANDKNPVQGQGSDSKGQGEFIDATGWLAVPALGEPHAHLDKALTADRMTGRLRLNSLPQAVEQWQEMLPTIDEADIRDRAARALGLYLANGVTAIRSHVDLPPGEDPLRGLRAVLGLRDELAGLITLQVVPLVSPRTSTNVIEQAIELGADVLGGCPHLADDPHAETTRLLDLAERTGLPVDLHTDERLDGDGLDLADLAEQVVARGMQQRVAASHCVRLSMLDPERLARTLDLVAGAGIALIPNPQTNLYLQGREFVQAVPRGIAPVRAMLDAGITVAAGGDNVRDPFNAVGRGDPLETASLLVSAAHLSPEEALTAVSTSVREVMGLPAGDYLLVPAQSLNSLVAGPGDERVVIGGGRVLARTRVERSSVLPAPPPGRPLTTTLQEVR